jgi:perosamine synthetase
MRAGGSALRYQLPAVSPLSLGAITAAVTRTVASGDPAPALERVLCAEYAGDTAILCSSGTDALGRAIRLAVAGDRRRIVALPAYGCFDIAAAAVGADARIALYDVDPVTLGPDWDSLRRAIADGASTAVIAPLHGLPVDWNAAERLTAGTGVRLIEDAAQAHGAMLNGRRVGSFGEMTVLSFGRGKGWTGGGGGALILRGAAAGESRGALAVTGRASSVRTAVGAIVQWLFGRPELYGLPSALPWLNLGETVYRPPQPARSIATVAAALAEQTRVIAYDAISHRRSIAARYAAALQEAPGMRMFDAVSGGAPGYLRFPVLLTGRQGALNLPAGAARHGIMRGYPASLATLDAVVPRLEGRESDCPGADTLAQRLLTLPTHPFVTPHDVLAVLAVLAQPGSDRPAGALTGADRSGRADAIHHQGR